MSTPMESRWVLEASLDANALTKCAESLASGGTEELKTLEPFLISPGFLERLNGPGAAGEDRYRRIILALGKNPDPYATEILRALLNHQTVIDEPDRIDVILEAAAALKPLPRERVPLFQSVPLDDYLLLNFAVLVENGSHEALKELKREILSKGQEVEDEEVIALMHRFFLEHRTDVPIIRLAENLLAEGISTKLQVGLYESFFDYRSRQWFGPAKKPPMPPPWQSAPNGALEALLSLGETAMKSELPDRLRNKIDEALIEIRGILKMRETGEY